MTSFRLINFLEDPALNGLRFEMGAPLLKSFGGPRPIRLLDEEALYRLGQEGIDVDDFSEIKVERDGTLSYKGKRVIVYIRDISRYQDRQSLPRFHLSYCRTLQQMRDSGRWQRYVVANRDDGHFVVNFVAEAITSSVEPLCVCQNCLAALRWEGFAYDIAATVRRRIVMEFTLPAFFAKYPKDLLSVIPTYTSETAPLNDYSEDWGMISESFKRRRGYQCEGCHSVFGSAERHFLHVHHRDGQKHNNDESNLEVLCIRCHAGEPMHGHMKFLPQYAEFVRRFPAPGSEIPAASATAVEQG